MAKVLIFRPSSFAEIAHTRLESSPPEPAGEQKAQRRVRVQTLFHPGDQLFPDVFADGLQIVGGAAGNRRQIGIANEALTVVIVSRREGQDVRAKSLQILRFAGKSDAPVGEIAVIKRADPDGVPGGDQPSALPVVQDQSKFRVQLIKHAEPVFLIQRQQQLTVGIAGKGIALRLELTPFGPPSVELAVAHQLAFPAGEGLHAPLIQPHDGEAVKAEQSRPDRFDPGVVRTA